MSESEPPEEDPFARWAHRRDPDLDALEAKEAEDSGAEPKRPGRPAGTSRYGWFVGLIVLLVLAYISLNTLRTSGLGSGVPEGRLLPPFAVPFVGARLTGDANIARRANGGHPGACQVELPGALNFCRVARGRPVVIGFASTQDSDTLRQLDAMQAVSRRFPRVLFLGIFLRGDRRRAVRLRAEHGWTFPVGWDRHADVAAVYGVKSLPVVVFGDARRRSRGTIYTKRGLGATALAARVRALARR